MKVVFVKTEWGGFNQPPYTDEENWEFEQRLQRGGDIIFIHQPRQDRPAPLPDDPEQ